MGIAAFIRKTGVYQVSIWPVLSSTAAENTETGKETVFSGQFSSSLSVHCDIDRELQHFFTVLPICAAGLAEGRHPDTRSNASKAEKRYFMARSFSVKIKLAIPANGLISVN